MQAMPASAAAISEAILRLKSALVTDNDSSRHADAILAAKEKLEDVNKFNKLKHLLDLAIASRSTSLLEEAITAGNE